MTDERMMVAISVLEDKLSPDALSLEEIVEIQQILMNLVEKRHKNCLLLP